MASKSGSPNVGSVVALLIAEHGRGGSHDEVGRESVPLRSPLEWGPIFVIVVSVCSARTREHLMNATETISEHLHWWYWLLIIVLLLFFLRQALSSFHDAIRTQTTSIVEHLDSIDGRLRHIESLLSEAEERRLGAEDRREQREKLRTREQYIESQRQKWHEHPEPPDRRSPYERLHELERFVEKRRGLMEDVAIPSEVTFVLPERLDQQYDNKSIFAELEAFRVCSL
jgi:hypothetical protein